MAEGLEIYVLGRKLGGFLKHLPKILNPKGFSVESALLLLLKCHSWMMSKFPRDEYAWLLRKTVKVENNKPQELVCWESLLLNKTHKSVVAVSAVPCLWEGKLWNWAGGGNTLQ